MPDWCLNTQMHFPPPVLPVSHPMSSSAAQPPSSPHFMTAMAPPPVPTPEEMYAQIGNSAGNLGLQSGVIPQTWRRSTAA